VEAAVPGQARGPLQLDPVQAPAPHSVVAARDAELAQLAPARPRPVAAGLVQGSEGEPRPELEARSARPAVPRMSGHHSPTAAR
jgi:hypothetical protein